jgi:hypothetical protein
MGSCCIIGGNSNDNHYQKNDRVVCMIKMIITIGRVEYHMSYSRKVVFV